MHARVCEICDDGDRREGENVNNYLNPMNPYQMQPNYFNANYQPPQIQNYGAQARQSNVDWVYVNGLQGAREQIVQPGCTAWMMDNNEPMIYYKAVDQMGQPTLKAYRLTELEPQGPAPAQPAPQMDLSMFATREDVAAIGAKVDKLISEIGGMNV